MQKMSQPNPPKMAISANQFAKLMHSPASQSVASTQHYEGPTRLQALQRSNQGSANVNWESATVNRGEGSLAGYQKSNRGTLLETGF